MTSNQTTDVQIIGGGLAGLTAAAFIAQAGHSVTVHEQRGHPGGMATTDSRRGYRFNRGPHAFYLGGEGPKVLQRLGIRPRGVAPGLKGALMARDGATYLAPGGTLSLARTRLLSVRDKAELARLMGRLLRVDAALLAGVTVREWVDDLTHRNNVADVLHAMVRLSTYVHAPDQLSAQVAVSQLQLALSDGVIYLDGGWQQLVDSLAEAVTTAGGTISVGEPITEIPDAPIVVVAAGGPAMASKLTGQRFTSGPASHVSVLDLGLSAPPKHSFIIGVDEPIYLSAHGIAVDMAPPGAASLSLAQYLAPEDEPDRERLRSFARHAGIVSSDIVDERYLHRMCTVTAIASADSGGLLGRSPVEVDGRPGVFVAGDWVGPTGHLADAVFASAEQAARSALAMLATMRTSV